MQLYIYNKLVKCNHESTALITGSALTQFLSLLSAIPSSLSMLLHALWPYALLGTGFILFVYINGGIVVGDRSHHVASLHLPQFLYFTW